MLVTLLVFKNGLPLSVVQVLCPQVVELDGGEVVVVIAGQRVPYAPLASVADVQLGVVIHGVFVVVGALGKVWPVMGPSAGGSNVSFCFDGGSSEVIPSSSTLECDFGSVSGRSLASHQAASCYTCISPYIPVGDINLVRLLVNGNAVSDFVWETYGKISLYHLSSCLLYTSPSQRD